MYVVNVLTALIFGTLSLTWIWSFTDWFATVTAALGLGGILSWAAVVARIIPQKRFDALSAYIDASILPSRTFFVVQLVLWVLFFGFQPWSSTAVILDNSAGRALVRVVVEPVTGQGGGAQAASKGTSETGRPKSPRPIVVPVGQKRLVLLDTGLFDSKRYRLTPRGAPDVTVEVTYLEPTPLALPDVFYRDHTVLLYPSVTLWKETKRGGPTLRIDGIKVICNGAKTPIGSIKPKNIRAPRKMPLRDQGGIAAVLRPHDFRPSLFVERLI